VHVSVASLQEITEIENHEAPILRRSLTRTTDEEKVNERRTNFKRDRFLAV